MSAASASPEFVPDASVPTASVPTASVPTASVPGEAGRRTTVKIGGGQGFFGDAVEPVAALAEECDYLIMDGLAELTLAILQKDRQRDETLGYVRDLLPHMRALLPSIVERGLRVVTNAGGLNPIAAGRAVQALARESGARVRVATVVGDDITALLPDLGYPDGQDVRFANAYTGAAAIVEALDAGADVVITGRVADSALALGPLVHEFGWAWDDWDLLGAGTMVGHLLECSGQATGGNLSWRWWESPTPWELPFPVAEVWPDGTMVLGKVQGSGGMVTYESVREQLLYEIHDPAAYIVPDVVADLSGVSLQPAGPDLVRMSGVRGHPAPAQYKALVCTPAGWTGDISIGLGWPDAPAKAKAMASIIRHRAEDAGIEVSEWWEEIWGYDALLPGRPMCEDPSEVVLRVAWRCSSRADAGAVGRLVPPLYTSGPVPGMTTAGRSFRFDASELLQSTAVFVDRAVVDKGITVTVEEA
jgi:hypothetical protein